MAEVLFPPRPALPEPMSRDALYVAPPPPAPAPEPAPVVAFQPPPPAAPPSSAPPSSAPPSSAAPSSAAPSSAAPSPAAPIAAAPPPATAAQPAAPPAPPPLAELVEVPDLAADAVAVERPGFWAGQRLRLPVLPPAAPTPPLPLIDGTAPFAEGWLDTWHRQATIGAPRDVGCYFLCDAVVSGTGQVWLQDRLVTAPEVMPPYLHGLIGLPHDPQHVLRVTQLPVREIAHPCAVLFGGMHVYGHLLIETLFHVLLVRHALRGTGLGCRYLLPRSAAPWALRMLQEDIGIAADDIEFYDPATERVRLHQAILPAVTLTDAFHPAADALLTAWLDALALPPSPAPEARRLFLTRGHFRNPHSGNRVCTNEAALAEYAATRHGFVAVAMETLPWRAQIALMRQAEIIVGQFGSAMHGALFARPGTRVAVMGFANLVQSQIAALRGQRMAYMTRHIDLAGDFTIDAASFAGFLDQVCAAA